MAPVRSIHMRYGEGGEIPVDRRAVARAGYLMVAKLRIERLPKPVLSNPVKRWGCINNNEHEITLFSNGIRIIIAHGSEAFEILRQLLGLHRQT